MKNIKALLTLITTVTFVVSPALTSPFSGFRADQLPIPQIDPPVQPAGYAFAIWGLIYGWLVVAAVFGLWKRIGAPDWDHARLPLVISLAVGTPWLAVANQSAVWATIMIFIMAAAAIHAHLRAPARDQGWFGIPVAIYAGWLTAASFVSLGSTAAGYGLITGAQGWAYAGILGALIATTAVFRKSGANAYRLTVVWALVGIIVANGTENLSVTALAALGIVALLLIRPSAASVTS
ncbi:hypothetical protein [Yoonia sediminilitoris]|uniref:TspO/MBR related protein n=1 Tax=Yoonia sediminilitoris TaxID=1286148 RepID=A0A2T6KDS5_9RHOB|nr:hypothetical protein [Yoonia sediminilitoris]PUB13194.1 hypothetical protein C8N45_108115 [Yoonia sediminilitoris]RCW94529.1 hypothetical protein DFP92_108116 [Yoonia sediminilitoris]